MRKILVVLAILCLMALTQAAFAVTSDTVTQEFGANVNPIAVVDVSGTAAALTLMAPEIGGSAIPAVHDNTSYAQYTSVVAAENTRSLTAAITTGSVPAGCLLKLTAGTPSTSGVGALGTAKPQITLSATDQDIITSIGSCSTGTGGTLGSNLDYQLSVNNIADVVATTLNNVTITLTLTDEAVI